jgi:lipopolysaccharide export system protein LptA
MITRIAFAIIAILSMPAVAVPVATAQTVDTKAVSQDAKTPKDVDVEADQMEVLDKEQRAVFKGHVIATRGTTTVKCDTLTVIYEQTPQANGEKKTDVTFLDAVGNTTITTSGQTITGEKAHMDVKANTVTVEGNVKVVQGKTIVTGQKLVADLNTSKSEMTGGRVKGSFVPGQ